MADEERELTPYEEAARDYRVAYAALWHLENQYTLDDREEKSYTRTMRLLAEDIANSDMLIAQEAAERAEEEDE